MKMIEREDGVKLAYVYSLGARDDLPLVMFCGGYRSDMEGTKALYLEAQCRARGQSYVRFDYRGHGASGGVFDESTIGDWKGDALAVFDHVRAQELEQGRAQKVLIVGSSMGGWIGLLIARERPEAVAGFIGIAAAPDFSEDIYHKRLDDAQRETLEREGIVYVPNDYSDEPYAYSLDFYEEAKAHLLLQTMQQADFPMRLIQGRKDVDVPYAWAQRIAEAYEGSDVSIYPVEEGDHRLSKPEELAIIDSVVCALSGVDS